METNDALNGGSDNYTAFSTSYSLTSLTTTIASLHVLAFLHRVERIQKLVTAGLGGWPSVFQSFKQKDVIYESGQLITEFCKILLTDKSSSGR